jgi:hypothetical protein
LSHSPCSTVATLGCVGGCPNPQPSRETSHLQALYRDLSNALAATDTAVRYGALGDLDRFKTAMNNEATQFDQANRDALAAGLTVCGS